MAAKSHLERRSGAKAKRFGRRKPYRAAIHEMSAQCRPRKRQRRVLELFGNVDWDPEYDYKAERRRR